MLMQAGYLPSLNNGDIHPLAVRLRATMGAAINYYDEDKYLPHFDTLQLFQTIFPEYTDWMMEHPPGQHQLALESQPIPMPRPRFVPQGVRDPQRYWMLEDRIREHGKQFEGGQPFPGWNDNEYNIQYNARQLYVAGIGESEDEQELRKYAQFSSALRKSRMKRELLRKQRSCQQRDSPYMRDPPRDPDDQSFGFGALAAKPFSQIL